MWRFIDRLYDQNTELDTVQHKTLAGENFGRFNNVK